MNRRAISQKFLDELKSGVFKSIIDIIKIDPSLDLEMRGNAVTVYYRGCKILSIYDTSVIEGLDSNYLKETSKQNIPTTDISNIFDYFAKAKNIIDNYCFCNGDKLWEKELQQRVVYENNYSASADKTDFFIADMEWVDNSSLGGRADLLAFHWGHMNHQQLRLTLYIIEVKQGCRAIRSNAIKDDKLRPGLLKHYNDFENFIKKTDEVNTLKNDMLEVLKQKYELGLIAGLNDLFKNNRTTGTSDITG